MQRLDSITHTPKISIIITNYNCVDYLEQCLTSVLNSDYPDFEVIFVDNASTDGSYELVKKLFGHNSRVTIIRNKSNLGAATGKNIGIKKTKGEYVALLDGDTIVDKFWLREAIKLMKIDSTIGITQCKLIDMHHLNRVDYAGDYFSQYGFLIQRAINGKLCDKRGGVVEIFSAKDAGAVARLKALKKAGLFDQDYFMYFEESDLCWRMWLAGYRVIYVPTSIVYHASRRPSKVKSPYRLYLAQYYGTRNIIMSLIKNLDGWNLIKILPMHLSFWIGMIAWCVLRKELTKARWIMLGALWNLKNIRLVWMKRKIVQELCRKNPDKLIMPRIVRKCSFGYFYDKAKWWGKHVPISPSED